MPSSAAQTKNLINFPFSLYPYRRVISIVCPRPFFPYLRAVGFRFMSSGFGTWTFQLVHMFSDPCPVRRDFIRRTLLIDFHNQTADASSERSDHVSRLRMRHLELTRVNVDIINLWPSQLGPPSTPRTWRHDQHIFSFE